MADAKSKKPAADKKIIDVKQSGDAASGTSRQIILNNRPIMQDPMMAEVSELANEQVGVKNAEEETETPGAPAVTNHKKVIPVAHNDAADALSTEKVEEQPKKTSKPAKLVVEPAEEKPESAKAAEPLEVTQTNTTTEESVEKPAPTETEAKEPETKDAASTPVKTVEVTKAELEDESAAAKPAEPTKEEPEETTGGGFAGERAGVNAGGQAGRSFDETDAPTAPTDDSGTEDKSDAKDKKPQLQPGELTPEQQKAFDSGKYFLPIITTETRRMRLEIILAAVFIVLVLAVWLDIMLDAGLLHVSGVQPVTHFFKS